MKYKKLFLTVLFLLAILAGTTAHVTAKQKADPLQPEIAAKILRFHVLANSDSDEDQALKFKVRDRIIAECSDIFSDEDDIVYHLNLDGI